MPASQLQRNLVRRRRPRLIVSPGRILPRVGRLASTACMAAGLVVFVSAVAVSACVPQPLISLDPKSSGPSGSQVTVNVFSLSGGRAELRWNSIDGEMLATGGGSELSQSITIPQVPPGLYSIILLERTASGALAASGRAAFEVTGSDGIATTGAGSEVTPKEIASRRPPSAIVSASLAALGGAVLVGFGFAGGIILTRRRAADSGKGLAPGS